jgi:DNA segregation ATPase FtsK/SpoIIIE, S-DNA-T family
VQRSSQPRANVITPAIRSLLPAKVALRVVDARESQVALGEGGAERLLGNGDLLFKCIGPATRLQGAWLPTEEESQAVFGERRSSNTKTNAPR